MTKPNSMSGIISSLRAGDRLSLRNWLRLRLWQGRQHRRYLAWLYDQDSHWVDGYLIWGLRLVFGYALAGLILWLVTPLIGLGFALLLAMLAWLLMGAYWLS